MGYYSFNTYIRERFGNKLYKLALSAAVTCPNRDGTKGSRGCIFCSEGGSGEFAADRNMSISEQIDRAKKLVKSKNPSGKYIAYFQAFTNTYGDINYLEKNFFEAAEHEDVYALSIATRPDCLGDDVMDLLSRLANKIPLFVELGLQTVKPESVSYIRRGYPNEAYAEAVEKLHMIGANVVTHVILGLPGEDREDMLNTVSYAAKCGTDGIKLQLLHVLKNTDLAKDYAAGKFKLLSEDEYIDILLDCIEHLPPSVVIHRLTGDGDKRILIAPLWSGNKKEVLNRINKAIGDSGVIQGSKL